MRNGRLTFGAERNTAVRAGRGRSATVDETVSAKTQQAPGRPARSFDDRGTPRETRAAPDKPEFDHRGQAGNANWPGASKVPARLRGQATPDTAKGLHRLDAGPPAGFKGRAYPALIMVP
ncbi:hypothetical protein GCM10027610_134880 [Dactylosporangium cerinum]